MHSLSEAGCQNCDAIPLSQEHGRQSLASSKKVVENFSPGIVPATDIQLNVAHEPRALLSKMQDVCASSDAVDDNTSDLSHQVLTMIMHDIKSPLSTIQLCLEIVEALTPNADADSPAARALIRAQANIERVQKLADDVLMQEKIKSGTLVLNLKSISLECVVKDCIDSLTALAYVHNIEFVVEGVKTVVFADKVRLGQILQNLLCNAISFSPPGSSVKITAAKQSIENEEYMVVRVEDNGPGIPESVRAGLFKAFQQLPNGVERNGTYGLGLAICEMLVNLHKGKIWVEAKTGRGCTFCIALPCC